MQPGGRPVRDHGGLGYDKCQRLRAEVHVVEGLRGDVYTLKHASHQTTGDKRPKRPA